MHAEHDVVASGLQAMSGKMATHAHNIANSQTPGYRRLVARTIERPEGGVDLSITRDQEPLEGLGRGDSETVESSELAAAGPFGPYGPALNASSDLIEDQVGMIEAQHGFEAMVAVYKREEQAMGSLFDAFA